MNDERNFFITVSGLKVRVEAVSYELIQMATDAIERQFRDANEPIDVPTYEVETAGGSTETHPHEVVYQRDKDGLLVLDENKERIVVSSTLETEEDRAAWALYDDAISRMNARKTAVETELIIDGVVVDEQPEWIAKRNKFGIPIPDDPEERRLHFLSTEILKCPEDYVRAIGAVQLLSLSGIVPPEEIESLMDSFRGYLSETAERAGVTRRDQVSAEEIPEAQE